MKIKDLSRGSAQRASRRYTTPLSALCFISTCLFLIYGPGSHQEAEYSLLSLQHTADVNDSQQQKDVSNTNHLLETHPSESIGPISFVLFLGIEGTGHHFWQDVIKESPAYKKLVDAALHPQYSKPLMRALYRHKNQRWKGLWSSTCKWQEADPSSNTTEIQENVSTLLREASAHATTTLQSSSATNGQSKSEDGSILFPVNFLSGGNEFGVISYPGFLRPCRPLIYPNLDVWYESCEAAGVICKHVYIYRDPYSIIKSTTENRKFNSEALDAIHLYTTQLRILHSQLISTPNRLIGCWNFDEPESWNDDVRPILQFESEDVFDSAISKIYKEKAPLTSAEKLAIVPTEYDSYMKSMIRIHELVVSTCQNNK